ncbi:hypothetical protein QUF76_00510 [Desulfobacterales bacterium HSG16]|nr:hypothetical protein [Desulfobacterales bacterium HSG16]
MNKKNSAVILGASITGLSLARSLGRAGVMVFSLDFDTIDNTFWSRYGKKHVLPNGLAGEKLAQYIKDFGAGFVEKPVLYADRDEYVFLLSKHRKLLEPFFRLCLPEHDKIELVNNKASLAEEAKKNGIGVPEMMVVKGGDIDFTEESQWNFFPAVIKPLYGYMVFTGAGFKTEIIKDKKQLLQMVSKQCTSGMPHLIQEMIPGSDENVVSVCCYISRSCKPLGVSSFKKICQSPEGNGIGILVKSEFLPISLEERLVRFLCDIGFYGLAEAEFKLDENDGQYKLIEINTRPWLQIDLAARCGCNLGYISFADLCGLSETETVKKPANAGMYWVFELPFINHVIRKKKHICHLLHMIPGPGFMKRVCPAIFAFDDPGPFIRYLRNVFFKKTEE